MTPVMGSASVNPSSLVAPVTNVRQITGDLMQEILKDVNLVNAILLGPRGGWMGKC